jgi:biotin transport system substrate-specific component
MPTLFGPTGGYLLAFPAAAAVAGALAQRARGALPLQVAWLALAALAGTLVVYAGGTAQLSLLTGDPGLAVRMGVIPFLIGDAAKLGIAVVVALRIRRRTLALI